MKITTKSLCLMLGILLITCYSQTLLGQKKFPVPKTKVHSNGVPASPHKLQLSQPDGTKLDVYLKGDGAVHWYQSTDGYTLLKGDKGFYEYAITDNDGNLKNSGIKASNNKKNGGESDNTVKAKKDLRFSKAQVEKMKKSFLPANGNGPSKAFPSTGTRNLLLILINFPDQANTYPQSDFDNLMNQENYNGTGSFKDYYLANSFGQLTLQTTVVGWYTASHNHDYYCDDCMDADPNNTYRELVREAVDAAEANGVDFSNYDNDEDGVVDGVMVIHQGDGAEEGDATNIWSHSFSLNPGYGLSDLSVTYDGVLIDDYTMNPETASGGMGTIGVICHEFGHNLGLPDYYDTDYSGSGGESFDLGYWDVMASGSYNNDGATPSMHNSFSRNFLGWQETAELTSPVMIDLPNAAENNVSYYYSSTTDGEYFWLENRQQVAGTFDEYIPGNGMLIYHIDLNYDGWGSNDVNVDPSHNGMDIEEADNIQTSGTVTGDAFPGTSGIHAFTDATTPGSLDWAGNATNKPVTEITENAGVISFAFMGGDVNNPGSFAATPVSENQIDLSWTLNAGNDPVLVVWSTDGVFGTPADGATYTEGSTLPGGGTVLYYGSSTSASHTSLLASTAYHYKAWSNVAGTNYSHGTTSSAKTLCGIQTIPVTEDFEAGALSECWSVEGTDWAFTEGGHGGKPASAHGGNYNALFYNPSYTADISRLVSPVMDLSSSANVMLSFWHAQATWGGDQDELRVYYRTSPTGSWTMLAEYTQDISDWTNESINLPELSAQYQVAFEATGIYGYGVAIDDIEIKEPPQNEMSAELIKPAGIVIPGNTITPKVKIKNNGINSQTNYSVTITSNPAGYSQTLSSPGSIAYGETLVLNFPQWTPSNGNYSLTATVVLTDDENASNDFAISEIEVRTPVFGELVTSFNAEAAGCAGIETDGTNIYTSYWNPSVSGRDFDKYSVDGMFLETFSVTDVSAVRDMAYNPTTGHFYGAAANTSLFEMDLANKSLVNTITAPIACRAIAYDKDDNTFWANNWDADLTEFDINGTATGRSFPMASIYGATYDYWSNPSHPSIWVFEGTGDANATQLTEYNLDGTITGRTIDVSAVPDFNNTIGSGAGGLASFEDNGHGFLLANIQQDPNLLAVFYLPKVYMATFNVNDGTNPIEGAIVYLNEKQYTTDANGSVSVRLENGTFDYLVSADGYNAATGSITVSNADITETVSMTACGVVSAFPFSEDFELAIKPSCWEFIDGDCGWNVGADAASSYFPVPNHTNYAYVSDDACNGDMSDVWMISPTFDLTGTTVPRLSFSSFNYQDSCIVKISVDGGSTWTDLDTLQNNLEWTTLKYDLSPYTSSSTVKIAFHYDDNGSWGYGWVIDDIRIFEPKAHDLAITSITPVAVQTGSTVVPKVTIQNIGYNSESTWSVTLSNGASYSSTKENIKTLAEDSVLVVSMDEWTPAEGEYTLTATATLTDDGDVSNNTLAINCNVVEMFDAFVSNASLKTYNIFELGNGNSTVTGGLETDPFPMAEEFNGVNIYRIYDDFTIGTVGIDGTYNMLDTMTGISGTPTGIAYNWTTGVMYVMVIDANNLPQLCTLNMSTYELTLVGKGASGMLIAMDFASDGFLYGPGLDDKLYKIDPATGATTSIGAIGFNINYGQDVSYDIQDSLLYTISCGSANLFGTYDLTTGAFTELKDMGTEQFATIVITKKPMVQFHVSSIGSIPMANATIVINGKTITTDANGVASIGLLNNAYDYTVNGSGYYEKTGNVTMAGSNVHVYVELKSTSVKDEYDNADIKVYPNPSTGLFRVSAEGKYNVKVYDMSGKVVHTSTINVNNHEIDLTNQKSGLYFIELVGDRKCVIQVIKY